MKRAGIALSAAIAAVCIGMVATAAPPKNADAKSAGKALARAVASQKSENVEAPLRKLLDMGGEDALKEVLKLVAATTRGGSQTIYWQLINGASGFQDKAALEYLGTFVLKQRKQPFAKDLVFGLENNASPNTVVTLAKIIKNKKAYDLQLMAADQLGHVHTSASVDALIETLTSEGEKGDPELRRRILSSLASITKENLGTDGRNWIDWWKVNKKKGLKKIVDDAGSHGGGAFASSTMNRDRKKQFESLKRNKDRIIVISSRLPDNHPKEPGRDYNLDHMEQILDGMKIPHKVVLKDDFNKNPEKYLKKAWTVLINCNYIQKQCICKTCRKLLNERKAKGGSIGPKKNRLYGCPPECSVHDPVTYRLSKETVMKLKKWVEAGGYLFTEDWGIIEVVEIAWPKLVTSDFKDEPQPGGTSKRVATLVKSANVKIVPGKGMTSRPLLRGVFTRPRPPAREEKKDDDDDDDSGTYVRPTAPKNDPVKPPSHQWQIDDESPAIKVESRAVNILMRSEDLKPLANGNDAVAVTFRAGRGKPTSAARKKKRKVTGGSSGGVLSGKSRGRREWAESLPGGRVLHVMSHFGKQQGSKDDTFVLQNLILNFIMESNKNHGGF